MQPTFGNAAVPVTLQPLYVPVVTHVVPQVWPGVPRVWGQGAQLPPGGPPPSVRQLPPWGLHPGTAPPAAPAHRWGHPLQAGTPQPPQPMGLWPGAVFHAQPPQPAGGCPLQDPHRRVLPPAPPAQQQGLPAPCTLPASWQQAAGPFADAVVLTEGQGHPAPTDACPQPTAAPLGCSSAALDSGAATASADVAEDVADLLPWISGESVVCRGGGWASTPRGGGKAGIAPAGIFLLFAELTSNAGILVDTSEIDDVLAWLSNEGTPSSAVPGDKDIDSLLTWMAEASSCPEVPQPPLPAVPSSLSTSPAVGAAPDLPTSGGQLGREAQAVAGPLGEPFSGQPASSESRLRGHLMEEARQRQPRVLLSRLALPTHLDARVPPSAQTARLMEEAKQRQPRVLLSRLALPTHLDARVPPSAQTARLMEEAKQRQPRVLLARLALPPGCTSFRVPDGRRQGGIEPAECPAPARSARKGRSRGREQRKDSVPAGKRKLPPGHDAPRHKRRR
ncbi:nascent polypeptide-associated complex subunit alpha, muscle-specific form-like isoform X2 [Lagopus muta]|uniref:nascent polypeptide-associated complex subunit alpha, muscle-specific form-like isoform X2 n=1 Tax=Lagopus muta TaxID=64668 RepID=UPI00209C75B6|nr:nascent polypeptide-associated complex subunit alpha, muscle-specific form-like isoform X2 [Lagopus muta]XP_048784257.1 nascent polypeptide-associated complex subunit alpha, muscle-specific form-like isoform X3 [Lagopus muta]XP_048784258.1 nascent polypeptide-associated complex subunit alpha, muscle-specific form-like isoform X4 [Lagopus muta]XP_048784260.1 nascent polypeptide-associated complex subunit alpha, muscle-specific form-like isoform X2 [Lagopus muta]